jgi:UDP-N-acetylmuramate--alanine ligase
VAETVDAHFIGIGGAGMSAIARVLSQMGWKVSGSDLKESRNTERLREAGIIVHVGHAAANIDGARRVVVSSAIPAHNPEVVAAREREIPLLARAQMLGEIAAAHRTISVAGTHGKTTTTSMIALVLERAGLDPTILIGGELNDIGTNAKYGAGNLLVTEADESDGSLLAIAPTYLVLTNVELDHPDHYPTYEAVEEIFETYLGQVPADGLVFYWADAPNLRGLVGRASAPATGFGLTGDAEIRAVSVEYVRGGSKFAVERAGVRLGDVTLKVPGEHNVLNALATVAVALETGVQFETIATVLESFSGAQRRFQPMGAIGDVEVVDDYAHHPTEVRATLDGAATGDWDRIVAIFQPHRYSRTHVLGRDFGEAFRQADMVVLTDVYGAGEEPIPGVSGKVILDALLEHDPHRKVAYIPRASDIASYLSSEVRGGDLVLTMGAGDIWQVGPELLGLLSGGPQGLAGES